MNDKLQYRLFGTEDLEGITRLLVSNELPVSDINTSKIQFIVSTDGENIIGCIGIEQYGKDGLLRSFAVDPNYRDRGIGGLLLQKLLAYCRQLEIVDVHLLTTTADKYFQTKGFDISNRDNAPDSIKATEEFSSICPASSVYMTLKSLHKRALLYADEVKLHQEDEETQSSFWAVKGEKLMLTYFEVPPNKTFKDHSHDSEQITHVLEGKLFFQFGRETFCVEKGGSIVVPSNLPHKVWTTEDAVKAVDAWTPINEKYK